MGKGHSYRDFWVELCSMSPRSTLDSNYMYQVPHPKRGFYSEKADSEIFLRLASLVSCFS